MLVADIPDKNGLSTRNDKPMGRNLPKSSQIKKEASIAKNRKSKQTNLINKTMKKIILVFLPILFGSALAIGQEQWTLLNTSNSDIPSDRTISLGISSGDIVYIGTPGGYGLV